MKICPTCQQPIIKTWRYGPLFATEDPMAIYHNGLKLEFRRQEVAFMIAMMRTGFASYFALEMLTAPKAHDETVKVVIARIRPKLPDGVKIHNIRHQGYNLELEP